MVQGKEIRDQIMKLERWDARLYLLALERLHEDLVAHGFIKASGAVRHSIQEFQARDTSL